MHEFKYLAKMVIDGDTNAVECENKIINRRRVAGTIKVVVSETGLNLQCEAVSHESILILTLIYEDEDTI